MDYSNSFHEKFVDIKKDIKEINPFYSQYQIFKEFNINHRRVFNREMNKKSHNTPLFFSEISEIILAKGGGWKINGKNDLSKLGKFSTSFSLPRIYFIDPENFDYDRLIEINQNWKGHFTEIEKMLSNEQ